MNTAKISNNSVAFGNYTKTRYVQRAINQVKKTMTTTEIAKFDSKMSQFSSDMIKLDNDMNTKGIYNIFLKRAKLPHPEDIAFDVVLQDVESGRTLAVEIPNLIEPNVKIEKSFIRILTNIARSFVNNRI